MDRITDNKSINGKVLSLLVVSEQNLTSLRIVSGLLEKMTQFTTILL